MAVRPRALEIWLALGGFAAGLAATAIVLTATNGGNGGPATPRSSPPVSSWSVGPFSPAALDHQWVAYSDASTCADRSGGDGASAVRLSPTQVAWFFSDSFLGPAGPTTGFSKLSGFVHNLIVIQTVSGRRSRFVTITGGDACTAPGDPGQRTLSVIYPAIAGGTPGERYWADDGMLVGSRVVRFYTRYLPGPVPYVPVETVIATFGARQLRRDGMGSAYGEVIRPTVTSIHNFVPLGSGLPIVWGTALLRDKRYAYIYGWRGADPRSALRWCYLARVPVARITDVSAWRYYAGNGRWTAAQGSAQPVAGGPGLSLDTGFSVVAMSGRYWLIEQSGGFGSADIAAYPAARPWGPFNAAAAVLLYHAPGIGLTAADNYELMYSVRAEPGLSDRHALVISYSVNSLAVDAGCTPLAMYTNVIIQPRFVAVPYAAFARAAPGHPNLAGRIGVVSGSDRYPVIVAKHPRQWYNSWDFPTSCPPVPAVRRVVVRRSAGSMVLSWASSGIDVRYRVELSGAGADGNLQRVMRATQITLTGLTRGVTYLVRVVPVNRYRRPGPGAVAIFTA